MNKELRKLIVDVCNLYPKNVFVPYDLGYDVLREMERKLREKFAPMVYCENHRTVMSEIDAMRRDKKLACKQGTNCLQTPINLLMHHDWKVPKKEKLEDIDTVVFPRLVEQAPIQQPSNPIASKLPKRKKIRT